MNAGICDFVEQYPYSTLPAVMKTGPQKIPLLEDTTYNSNPSGTLKWLNETPDANKLEAVRLGLRHQYFAFKNDRSLNKPIL